MFPVNCGKCLSHKAVYNWVDKFSQGRSKVAENARPSIPVEFLTEADRRITIGSVATALGCSHGLARSILHEILKFREVWHGVCPGN
jgi:hypothetical protein